MAARVVAIVGSAGGLEAATTVLGGLPAGFDAAVIVLIHQQPDRENALVHLFDRKSALPVAAAQDDALLEPGTVVVAPPGKHLLVTNGPRTALIASGAVPPSRPSADLLLTTLAVACGARATAVVLSGHGHDGATGATAIHRFGGLVLASNEASSTYFSMPQATIERDSAIDQIVPLEEMASVLTAVVTAPEL
jgi:two-component system, chemotaxis family, protein-glutamate methylesterase/glutaminase